MMTHQEMIDVITHHMNGGKVECRDIEHDSNWVIPGHIDNGGFNFGSYNYRAKPEPMVLWAEIMPDGRHIQSSLNQFKPTNGGEIKKFIEEI